MAPKEIDKIKERQILEREIRKRLDFRRCNEIALDYKAKLKAKEKAEDEAWKSMIMAEAEKEAKLEQMGQQRRRMKMLELKKEADRLLVRFFFSNLYLPSRYRTIFLKMFIQGLVFKGILKGQESKSWDFFEGPRRFRGPQKSEKFVFSKRTNKSIHYEFKSFAIN